MYKVYAIMSGKGGVGKSTISALAAKIFSETSKVLLLDFDITGPSQKFIFNQPHKKMIKGIKGLLPLKISETLDLISMASLMKDTDSVIWRGPKKLSILELFWSSIGTDYDVIVVDMPPGLSEEHRYIKDKDPNVIIVTTPQNISLDDTITSIEFCIHNKIKIAGLIENMSGFKCEKCGSCSNIFGKKGGELLAEEFEIPFIGSIGIDTNASSMIEDGVFSENYKNTGGYNVIKSFLEKNIYY